jgi:CHAT domain-containing protein/Tfp pilus assembly protein PilF
LEIGSYSQAEALYRRTLAVREKIAGAEHPDTASSLNNLAMLYVRMGAYRQAQPLYERALSIKEKNLGPEHPDTANSINNLAILYARIGDNTQAESFFRRSLAIRQKALGADHPSTISSVGNLAEIYHRIGAYTEAETLLRRVVDAQTKALDPENPDIAGSIYNLAELYTDTGQFAKAELLFQRALEIRKKALGPEHPLTIETLAALGTLRWAEGKPDEALPLLHRAQIAQAKNIDRFILLGSEARKHSYLESLAENTDKNVSFSIAVAGSESIALGLISVLQYKGRTLDSMSDSMTLMRSSIRPGDRSLFEQFAQLANQYSTLTYSGPRDLSADTYRQQLNSLARQQETLETNLSKVSADFNRQIAPVSIASISRAIPKNAVLLEWFRYSVFEPKLARKNDRPSIHYAVYVLKHSDRPSVIDVGDSQAIEALVDEFRQAVSTPKYGNIHETSKALSEKLIRPLSAHLKGAEHILVSPDGALNLVPMTALVDERGKYLVQRFEVSYLTSGRDLLRMHVDQGPENDAIVVADPNFGSIAHLPTQASLPIESQYSRDLDRSGLVFRPLVNTALEARDLMKLLKISPSNALLGEEATEANLKKLHGPKILHVASHGFFLTDQELRMESNNGTKRNDASSGGNPLLRSGIALTGANERHSGTTDDGILTAMEVAQLDLHKTELVVLSACDSGIGDVKNGEGVYGLRRALVLAGAQTQVTSLWKVSDEATRMLMVDYYQRLLKGEGRSAALRNAQKAMLANPELSHPYYWASFVPTGDWTPLRALH